MVSTLSAKPERQNGIDSREAMTSGRETSFGERGVPSSGPKKVHVLDHPIAQHSLTALRDKHASGKRLRYFSNQLLSVLSLEATRGISLRDVSVPVSTGNFVGKELSKGVVFISLARHGLGLSHNIAELIPEVAIGSITLENLEPSGKHGRLEPRLHLTNAPALTESRVILFDPVVGSGLSAGIALHLLRKSGASDLALITFVISGPGLKRVQATVPETTIWTAAIDEDFDLKRGPVPGLGDFGDRLYSSES